MQQEARIALAGNPNAGKTTFFNALTGARQHVGNYPGVTVEKKEGTGFVDGVACTVMDLPGAYSLTAYTQEELVARNALLNERPDAVLAVLNAGALERNLYLTVQILEIGAPVALALNMMDEATRQGLRIDVKKLSALLNAPVTETVARTGKGVEDALRAAVQLAESRRGQDWTPLAISYGPDLDPVLEAMTGKIQASGFLSERYHPRWLALKYMENDAEILEQGRAAGALSAELEAMTARVAAHCQSTLDTYPEALIADYRYGYIASILKQGVLKRESLASRIDFSDRMDQFLTHRALGPILMLATLFVVYELTFALGDYPLKAVQALFAWLAQTAEANLPEGKMRSLLVAGVINGAGGVLSFVPLILIIFFLIAFLEDSGYMARIAYMLDRVFRIFGLHGASVMPFIISGGIGGGCAAPGVLAARTLRSRREKMATLLTAPYMTCGAKLPVFILLASIFFPERQALALFLITLTGWAVALGVARVLRWTVIRGPSTPFVMELPPYRLPTWRGMCIHAWERAWQYIQKAVTVLLAISVLIWAAMSFPEPSDELVKRFESQEREIALQAQALEGKDSADSKTEREALQDRLKELEREKETAGLDASVAGRLGKLVEPVSRYAGFDWRTNIALLGGLSAKEVILSTLGTAYSLGAAEEDEQATLKERLAKDPEWTTARGVSLMVFILLYSPCVVTLVVIRQEAGSWLWSAFSVLFNTLVAYGLAVATYLVWSRLG
jgi:ferrous iron transport protein B